MQGDTVVGADGVARCPWGSEPEIYRQYHDFEWGRAVAGDDALFERISLEAFQSGLSWITILRKRENFRAAFDKFRIESVAAYTDRDVERLLADEGIVRNRAKILATIANARAILELDGSLEDLLWSFQPQPRRRPRWLSDVPASTPESKALSKDLKKRGFSFVGPTTAYAMMQAIGMVDDHLQGCHRAG
ncbi:DNA-3-methyladenine glycosylase I [Natronoglycomyces albus]|uniref:DNA-3-methyladenine glycosylase I n=1 Tax=Natronoglycomyces albus TaxID=2811108 RepID=A0A895XT71_9ACTN|nr:DNA-3-methyladenine glycosylase I [Natronoglycomyces albus]QSB06475.1 DNA-3-methyladenine glycosylase I [Natronoglycomyces albus]